MVRPTADELGGISPRGIGTIDVQSISFYTGVRARGREGDEVVHVTEDGDLVSGGRVVRREYEEYHGHKPSDDWYATFDADIVQSGEVIGQCEAAGVLIHSPVRLGWFENEPCPVCGAEDDCSDEANGGDC